MSKTVDLDIPHSAEERVRLGRNFHVGHTEETPPACNHWPGQRRCQVCGMGVKDADAQ